MARYIDVEALDVGAYKFDNEDFIDGVTFILEKLDAIPTADVVEVKHGEWKVEFYNGKKFITCSACGSTIDCYATYIDENEYDGCPYCGAKMDGGKI